MGSTRECRCGRCLISNFDVNAEVIRRIFPQARGARLYRVRGPDYGRQRLISSQVSSVGSGLQPRWSFERRTATAFGLLQTDWLVTPVSHRLPFDQAPEAYRILDEQPDEAMGIVLVYPS